MAHRLTGEKIRAQGTGRDRNVRGTERRTAGQVRNGGRIPELVQRFDGEKVGSTEGESPDLHSLGTARRTGVGLAGRYTGGIEVRVIDG